MGKKDQGEGADMVTATGSEHSSGSERDGNGLILNGRGDCCCDGDEGNFGGDDDGGSDMVKVMV